MHDHLARLAERKEGYPRRYLVCVIDLIGLCISVLAILIYRPPFVIAALPVAIALQYAVSFLHHFMPFAWWRSKLDRSMIFFVIAATYVPYWGQLPQDQAITRLEWVVLAALVGCLLLLIGAPSYFIGFYWTVFASAGIVISLQNGELEKWLPNALPLFLVGSAFYGLQGLIYALKWPDPYPPYFGYRVVQHLSLLIATTIGTVVVLTCLKTAH